MSILKHTITRIFRNKIQLVFIILFPLAFMFLGFIGDEQKVSVAVIDHDQTPVTIQLIQDLEVKSKLKQVDEDEIEKALKALRVDYILVIEEGFTQQLLQGTREGLTGYSIAESNISVPIVNYLEQWLEHTATLAFAANQDQQMFDILFDAYTSQGLLQLQHSTVIDKGVERTRSVLGYLTIAMLYTSLIVGLYILLNKQNGTFYRTLAAPVSMRRYMLQTIGSFLLVSWIQITLIMLILTWVYKLYFGGAALSVYLMLMIFSLVAVAFGVAISSVTKSVVQACLLGICLVAPMAMLGGAYFPLDWAPDAVITMSYFTPVSWVLGGIEKLLEGQSILSNGKEVLVLLLFAIIFFLLGTFRKADIVK